MLLSTNYNIKIGVEDITPIVKIQVNDYMYVTDDVASFLFQSSLYKEQEKTNLNI